MFIAKEKSQPQEATQGAIPQLCGTQLVVRLGGRVCIAHEGPGCTLQYHKNNNKQTHRIKNQTYDILENS